ncbi:hypothetical protein [Chitinophaga sp. CB10]|uniref:hypothetical protein n=1 Tax=Chitinophaga sp. CB10 TaxID=1891659 RepID=UPI0025BF8FDB|nr:hypothetical protein [Chitinophaga sp. CB10]
MEKLLANKGINIVTHNIEWEKGELFERFLFTDKMAEKNIFIYAYDEKSVGEAPFESEEDDDNDEAQFSGDCLTKCVNFKTGESN